MKKFQKKSIVITVCATLFLLISFFSIDYYFNIYLPEARNEKRSYVFRFYWDQVSQNAFYHDIKTEIIAHSGKQVTYEGKQITGIRGATVGTLYQDLIDKNKIPPFSLPQARGYLDYYFTDIKFKNFLLFTVHNQKIEILPPYENQDYETDGYIEKYFNFSLPATEKGRGIIALDKPENFIAGDIISLNNKTMIVTGANLQKGELYVFEGDVKNNENTEAGDPSKNVISLKDAVTSTDGYACLGEVKKIQPGEVFTVYGQKITTDPRADWLGEACSTPISSYNLLHFAHNDKNAFN